MTAPAEILELVDRFERNRTSYLASHYNETQTRREFIDPFFAALGWDVDNRQGYAEPYKDVIHEDSIKIAGEPKAPDYCFRIGGTRKFFVEAKRPSINVAADMASAFQLRRYGWSSKLPLSVLTSFDQFSLYDCRPEPKAADSAAVARVMHMRYLDYPDRWDEIFGVLARESILRGSFDTYADSTKAKKGTSPVDRVFLAELDGWRQALARNVALRNKALTQSELNFAVQQTIDRLVFLRIAEDRGTEPYGQLRGIVNSPAVYDQLTKIFLRADERYNSGLFHFRREKERAQEPDMFTLKLAVGNKPLRDILNRMYYPQSPYEFSVIPLDILGSIYERFLGKVIRLTRAHQAVVEEKPEVKKAGGVYYTPTRVVEHIVEQTVGRILRDRNVSDTRLGGGRKSSRPFTVVDPACGSGSFLLVAYDKLLHWYLDGYQANAEKWSRGRNPRIRRSHRGDWVLTTSERKRILLDHIYGVDIDPQAVEVTKLSLLLKVLEGETDQTLVAQLSFFQERALPDLDRNIKCGNSLIEPDFYTMNPGVDPLELRQINPFSWKSEFPTIAGQGGFDVVIGNPPWLMAGYYLPDPALTYLRAKFVSASGKFDLYYTFLERALEVAAAEGRIGFIVPNKVFHTKAASALRGLLVHRLTDITDFGVAQLFEGATNYSAVLIMAPAPPPDIQYVELDGGLEAVNSFAVARSTLSTKPWLFADPQRQSVFERLEAKGEPLDNLTARFGTGMQTGADGVYVVTEQDVLANGLESGALRPFLKGQDVRRYWTNPAPPFVIFPYTVVDDEWRIMTESVIAKRCPRVYARLAKAKIRLSQRMWFGKTAEELSGKWYGLMYLDAYEWFNRRHLLTPSLAPRSSFAPGPGLLFATGTAGVTSVVLGDDVAEHLGYLVGLLNSKVLSFYATRHSPRYVGGFYKFSSPYLRRLPIRRIDFSDPVDRRAHDQLVVLTAQLTALTTEVQAAKTGADRLAIRRELLAREEAVDEIVYELYDLTADQVRCVEQTASITA